MSFHAFNMTFYCLDFRIKDFFGLCFTFPDNKNSKTLFLQYFLILCIPFFVFDYFFRPVWSIRFWCWWISAVFVSMPETSPHINYQFVLVNDYIRLAGQFFRMQSVPYPRLKQFSSHKHFRPSVFRFNSRHIARTLRFWNSVHNGYNTAYDRKQVNLSYAE